MKNIIDRDGFARAIEKTLSYLRWAACQPNDKRLEDDEHEIVANAAQVLEAVRAMVERRKRS